MITVMFDPRSNLASIPPLCLRGAWEPTVVATHVVQHLKPRDVRDFSIVKAPGSREGHVALRRGKAEISFRLEGNVRTADGHPPADRREIVPPKWGTKK